MVKPHIVIDISSVKTDKLNALHAHASQTAWMMAETDETHRRRCNQ